MHYIILHAHPHCLSPKWGMPKPVAGCYNVRMFAGLLSLASAIAISGWQLADPEYQDKVVAVRGVVSSAVVDDVDSRYFWLTLRTDSAEILAAAGASHYALDRLCHLIDAEVILTGRIEEFSTFREGPGRRLLSLSADPSEGIRVIRPAPDPFGPEAKERRKFHKHCHEGTVTAVGRNRFCIATTTGKRLEIWPNGNQPLPVPGDAALVSGFLDFSYQNPTLTRARHQVIGHPGVISESPVVITNEADLNIDLHNRLIRIRGLFHHLPDGQSEIAVGKTFFHVECPAILPALFEKAPSGSVVELTGVHLLDFKADPINGFQTLDRLTVIPRTVDDIRVLHLPTRRILVVFLYPIGIVIVVLVGFLIRGHVIRRQAELKVRERTRLAVELHDAISQTLTGIAFQLENALEDSRDSAARHSLTTAEKMLAGCRAELQSCLWDLKSRTFDEKTMAEACQTALKPFARGARVRIRFHVSLALLTETEVSTILKIVRELTVNAIRHGGATSIRIAGEYREGTIRFSIIDNGRPFDPDATPGPSEGHFGLAGIRERLRAYDGTLAISRLAKQGMKRVVTLTGREK